MRRREYKKTIDKSIDEKVSPDHTKSAFLDFDESSYVVHRIGPGKEYEQLRGPYRDKGMACYRLAEIVENFIRENAVHSPHILFRSANSVKISVRGLCAGRDGREDAIFYYVIKPVSY